MDWKQLKERVYYVDGSLRDIYINDTDQDDWLKWVNYVNANYRTVHKIYETNTRENKIDLRTVIKYWSGDSDFSSTASVYLDNVVLNIHFFLDTEIENDLCPDEFNSIDDHQKLIDYMSGISKALNKKVILTPENEPDFIFISVDGEIINISV